MAGVAAVTLSDVRRLLDPLRTRLGNILARAAVQLVDDTQKMQIVQIGVLDGETREGCERFQQYGLTSVPLAGAEAVVLFPGGTRDHGLVVAVDDRRYRKTGLAAGEVALYHKDGTFVLLKSDRVVVDGTELRLGSDSAANFVALANLVDARLAAIRAAFNEHTHVYSPGPGTPVASAVPGALLAAQASVAAGKVKAE